MNKIVAGISCVVAAAGISTAVVLGERARRAESSLVAISQQAEVLRTRAVEFDSRLQRAEQRAAEAERDSGELLKAVEAVRTKQAARAPANNPPLPAGGRSVEEDERLIGRSGRIVGMVQASGRSVEEDERLANERAYQQELARRRAAEAKARAELDDKAARLSAEERYNALIEQAELHLARSEFQLGIRVYNRAMEIKPPELAVTERVKQLQAALVAQNGPVNVTLSSDGNTWVSITNLRAPSKFVTQNITILPGDYEIIGRRKGYRDVNMVLQVRKGMPEQAVTVVCTVSN